jgi:hypothetical protein
MMKSLLTISLALMVCSGVATADLSSSAPATVMVHVSSNVAVGVLTGTVDMKNIQGGVFGGAITFRVDANVQELGFSVQVSNLYKDDVASSIWLIPVNTAGGVLVVPDKGMPLGFNVSEVLPYDVTKSIKVGGFDGWGTQVVRYGSGDNGTFSQNVVVTPTWNQNNPQLPTGEYSGVVTFTAVI